MRLCLYLLLLCVVLAASEQGVHERSTRNLLVAKGGKPAPRPAPAPAPKPAPAPAPAPAPRPNPAPAPAPAPRPNPAPAPAPRPNPAPAPVSGPRPIPAPVPASRPVPNVGPRPVPPTVVYVPVRPVVPLTPMYMPFGYSYYFFSPISFYFYYPLILYPLYWQHHTCHQVNCQARYERCLANYYNDGCVCYPGFLQCVQNNCYSDYTPAYQQCVNDRANANRCVMTCSPQAYPDPAVAPVQYNLYSTIWIQGLNATGFQGRDYDFTMAIVNYLNGNDTSNTITANNNGTVAVPVNNSVVLNNVTLSTVADVIVNDTKILKIDVLVHRANYEDLNATATKFNALMFNQTMQLQQLLVSAGVLFDPTQLTVQTSQTSVDSLSTDGQVIGAETTSSPSLAPSDGTIVSSSSSLSQSWIPLLIVLAALFVRL